jgi:hypothetical protein
VTEWKILSCFQGQAIDLPVVNVLLFAQEGGVFNASILYEVPCQEGNEGCQGHNDEEWQASDPGCVLLMRHQDVPNRQELKLRS